MSTPTSPFSGIYAFGDSLSDAGDAFLLTSSSVAQTFGLSPEPVSPPYVSVTYTAASGGTLQATEFSNGPVWVQDLAGLLGLPVPGPGPVGLTTPFGYQAVVAGAANGTDFAIGGSVTGPTAENTGATVTLTDLSAQITNFEQAVSTPSMTALYTVWSGSNDLLNLLADPNFATLYATGVAAQDVTQSVNNEVAAVQKLVADGARSVLVVNVPDLGIVPGVTAKGSAAVAAASALASSFNTQLSADLSAGGFGPAHIYQENVFSLIDAAVHNPQAYGLTDVTDPVYAGSFTVDSPPPVVTGAAQNQYLFFDMLHPTETGHAAIAADVLQTLGLACYGQGTLIQTTSGDVPVEDLEIGALVLTHSGEARPVRWIGHRSYAGRFLASDPAVQPVRFRAGSLGPGVPQRDLLVSPEHAMFLDGVLVPARHLVNGTTVIQERGLAGIAYYHVELDDHDVIFAEGASSESFLDDGSRGMFQNAHDHVGRVPRPGPAPCFCAPRVDSGATLEAIRRRLRSMARTDEASVRQRCSNDEPSLTKGTDPVMADPDKQGYGGAVLIG